MVVVGILPIIAIGLSALISIEYFHTVDIAAIEDALLAQKSDQVRSAVERVTETFELQVGFEQTGDIELSGQYFLLEQLLLQNPSLIEVGFINLQGLETSRVRKSGADARIADDLLNMSRTEMFVRAKEGKSYISPVHYTLDGPAVAVASPVLNRNGIVISVLAGEINLKELEQIVAKTTLGEDGYIYVVDQDGFIIAHGRSPQLRASSATGVALVEDAIRDRAKSGVQGQRRYANLFGVSVVASGRYLENLRWGIVAEWPTRDADRVVDIVRNQVLLVLFIVLFITVILSIVLANRIAGPIKQLEAGTQLVAQGKFDARIEIRTNDEIEDLGAAFNKMIEGLKQLQQLKDEFVFIAAHELRTPVTAIKGYLGMVLEGDAGPISDQVKEFIQKVITANQRLIQLVNDLLQVARSEAGRLTIQAAPVDVIEPIKGVLIELAPLAAEKGITMKYEPPVSLPKAMADAGRLKEVIVNLVGNAIKYTIGAGTVAISHELQGRALVTHIKDSGVGISKEAQKRLFEKFYRVQTEQTRDITGTGLGLFIVKQIVEKMGGTIWVESEEGKGSTFSFSLPIA